MRGRWGRALVLAAAVAAAGVHAAPVDDHRRGLTAYQRGDVAGALSALRVAAQAGYAPSQSMLAFILERADEAADALRWYRAAAAQDDADGHFGLAGLLMTGRGVAKDEKAAFEHFSKAAALGQRQAIDTMATLWLTGQLGADAKAHPDAARAAVLRAAELGHLASAQALAEGYRSGRLGLPRDEAQSAMWQARVQAWRKESVTAPAPRGSP